MLMSWVSCRSRGAKRRRLGGWLMKISRRNINSLSTCTFSFPLLYSFLELLYFIALAMN